MKKRKLPKDVVAVETYKWDSDLQNYVLVKREPVERQGDDGKANEGDEKRGSLE